MILLLTSLAQGLSRASMRSIIQAREAHMGMYSAAWPDWPQLQHCRVSQHCSVLSTLFQSI